MMLPLARALTRLGYSYGGGVARLQLSVPMMRWMMGTEFIAMRMGKAANVAMFHPAPADLRTSSLPTIKHVPTNKKSGQICL
jgi:hypothetical protein